MKLGVIEIQVKDFNKCLKFYKDTLGLKIEAIEKDHKFVMFDTGTTKLALFGVNKLQPSKLSNIMLYFPVKDIESTVRKMKNKNIRFTSEIKKKHWGKVISFEDSEDNEHYLYEEYKRAKK